MSNSNLYGKHLNAIVLIRKKVPVPTREQGLFHCLAALLMIPA